MNTERPTLSDFGIFLYTFSPQRTIQNLYAVTVYACFCKLYHFLVLVVEVVVVPVVKFLLLLHYCGQTGVC